MEQIKEALFQAFSVLLLVLALGLLFYQTGEFFLLLEEAYRQLKDRIVVYY